MKEAAYDRLMGAIQTRIAANKAKLAPYYKAEPGSISAEEAITLRGELAALNGVLKDAEIVTVPVATDPVLEAARQPNLELAK